MAFSISTSTLRWYIVHLVIRSLCPLFNPHRKQKQRNLLSHVWSPKNTPLVYSYSLHFYFPSLYFSWVWQTNSFQLMKRCDTGVSPHPWRSWPVMPDKSLKYVSLGMDLSRTKCDVMRCNAARHGTARHGRAQHNKSTVEQSAMQDTTQHIKTSHNININT